MSQFSWNNVPGGDLYDYAGGSGSGVLGAGFGGAGAGALGGPWGALIGGGMGLVGAALGGSAANQNAADARGVERQNYRRQLMYLQSLLTGGSPAGWDGSRQGLLPPGVKAELDRLNAQINDPATPYATVKKLLERRDDVQRMYNYGELGTGGLPGLRAEIDKAEKERLGQFDEMALGFANSPDRKTYLDSVAKLGMLGDRGISEAMAFGNDARTAAQTAFDRGIASGLAGINKEFVARGMGGSSGKLNTQAAAVGQGSAGLAQAMAAIEAQRQGFIQSAIGRAGDLAGATADANRGELGFSRGLGSARFGLQNDFGNQGLDTFRQGNAYVSSFINPNAAIMNPSLAGGNGIGTNVSGMLGDLGGYLTKSSLQDWLTTRHRAGANSWGV